MDFLSMLTHLFNPAAGGNAQQQPAINPAQLPNKNQIPLGQSYQPWPVQHPQMRLNNVDRSQSIPYYHGQLPTPQAQSSILGGDVTGPNPYMYQSAYQPTLPDHQLMPNQAQPAEVIPSQGTNLLQLLTQGPQGRA